MMFIWMWIFRPIQISSWNFGKFNEDVDQIISLHQRGNLFDSASALASFLPVQ